MTLLQLTALEKTFRRGPQAVRALAGVNLELAAGDYVAIRGPSGCGKSTLLLTSGGLLRPDEGIVRLMGEDLYSLSPDRRAELRAVGVGFVFQQFHLVPYLNVLDNVLAATLGLPGAGSSSGAAEGRGTGGGTGRPARARAEELLERFGLADRRFHVPARLSVGERQRTALARALLNRPRLLLADEPTGNLDDANAEIVWQCLAEFAGDGGAVLLVTHDPRAARAAQVTLEMTAGQLASPVVAKDTA